jgi:hypothetical protein
VRVSWVEQFGAQEFGEKAPETPCGSPETEKLTGQFLEEVTAAVIVVVTDDPRLTVTAPEFESVKPDVFVDVLDEVKIVSELDSSAEVSEFCESAGTA